MLIIYFYGPFSIAMLNERRVNRMGIELNAGMKCNDLFDIEHF